MPADFSAHSSMGQPSEPDRHRRKPARERLLATADRMLYAEGLSGSGIDRIISEAGIAKGSLYGNFPSKDDLIDAYLSARHTRTIEVFNAIESLEGSLSDKIEAVFNYLVDQTRDDAFRGCAFVVAAAEEPDTDRPPMRWARVNKRAVYDSLLRILAKAGVARPETVAEQLCILYDGALISSALRPESDAVNVARHMAHILVDISLEDV